MIILPTFITSNFTIIHCSPVFRDYNPWISLVYVPLHKEHCFSLQLKKMKYMCVKWGGLLRLNYLCDRLSGVHHPSLLKKRMTTTTTITQTGFPKRKIKATPFPRRTHDEWCMKMCGIVLLRWAAICIQANILLLNKPEKIKHELL